jgi:hypothetical protein
MELVNIILSEVSKAQKAKNRVFDFCTYMDFISITNAVILLDMGHKLREGHIQE